jgi:hypothetical protein
VEERLDRPRALAVEARADSWSAYVLDHRALYRLASPDADTLTRLATRAELGLAEESDAMVLDAPARLLVIDHGAVAVIDVGSTPPRVVRRPLRTPGIVPGPLLGLGRHLIVGDLRSQEEPKEGSGDVRPADLVLVDRSNPSAWTERRLLEALPEGGNPLVAPVALALDGPTALLVLDLGLRPVRSESGDPFHKVMAESAAVYRVELDRPTDAAGLAVTGIERVTEPGRLTQPNGMTSVDGVIYISDPGRPVGADDNPLVRNLPGYVAVQVHFSRQRSADLPSRTRRTIAHDIATIVDRHKPASVVAAPPPVPTETERGAAG